MQNSNIQGIKAKQPEDKSSSCFGAESEGFEPPDQLPGHRISSAARSTTPATFQKKDIAFQEVKKVGKATFFAL